MADTAVSVRIPADVLADIDKQAAVEQRSRHWCILQRLRDSVHQSVVVPEPKVPAASGRPYHNTSTCRIYRCGMCAAIKAGA